MDSVEIGEGGVKQQKNNEVYATDGGTSIVVMEDDPDRDERPIPSRVFKQAKLPRARDDDDDDDDRRRNFVTKDVLPDEAVVQFADLDGLANPDKVSKPEAPKQEGPMDVFDNDGPVPARFPPPPPAGKSGAKSRAKRQQANNAPSNASSPSAPSAPSAPSTASATLTTSTASSRSEKARNDAPPLVLPRSSISTARKSTQQRPSKPAPARPSLDRSNNRNNYNEQEMRHQHQEEEEEPRRRRNQDAWESDYEVERDRHVEVYEMNGSLSPPPSRRKYFSTQGDERRDQARRGRDNGRGENDNGRGKGRRDAEVDDDDDDDLPFLRADNDDEVPSGRRARAEAPQPKISPEVLQKRREEDEKKEKMQLLHRLFKYEQRGYHLPNLYSMESNIDELRFEVSKIRNEESARHSVKWYKVFLMILVTSVETLNTKFDPFGLRLKGWSRDMNSKKEDLDDCFHRLHDKWSSKTAIEPELELMFAFFGGAFMYHLENAAESFGDIGNKIVTAITGSMGEGPASGNRNGGSTRSTNDKGMMTNMPSLCGHVGGQVGVASNQKPTGYPAAAASTTSNPQPARPARRVMKAPQIPSGAAEMANIMMMTTTEGQDDMDVPIPTDFEMPASIGGNTSVGRTAAERTSSSSSTPSSSSRTLRETGPRTPSDSKSATKSRGNRPPTTPSKSRSVAL